MFYSSFKLPLVFPHHGFDGFDGTLVVFCTDLFIVIIFNIAFHCKVNELTNWHSGIDPNWLNAGNLQGPGVAKTNIAFSGCGVDVNSKPSDAGLPFKKWNRVVRFGVFLSHAKVERSRLKQNSFFADFDFFDFIVFFCIQTNLIVSEIRNLHCTGEFYD